MSARKRLEEDLASLRQSYREARAEVERLRAILHQTTSAIRASLEVRTYVRVVVDVCIVVRWYYG